MRQCVKRQSRWWKNQQPRPIDILSRFCHSNHPKFLLGSEAFDAVFCSDFVAYHPGCSSDTDSIGLSHAASAGSLGF